MADRANSQLSDHISAAFGWWREAGVDRTYNDDPADWLAAAENTIPMQAGPAQALTHAVGDVATTGNATAPPAPAVDPAGLPRDLAAFTSWWLTDPLLDDGRTAGRVLPRGEPNAELMIIVPEPEDEDRERLLSGPQGRLLEALLAAMEITPEQAYLASALPRHTPMADWTEAKRRGLDVALRHHVALVAPRRAITFGLNILPLLGHDPSNSGHFSRQFNHGELSIPLLAATELGFVLARPRAKAKLWRQLLDWTGS